MAIRGCRIAVSFIAVLSLLLAIALTLAAITTPQWQVADMEQVHQIRYVGLYQSCAYGHRQGPNSIPRWVCTYIPYGQPYLSAQYNLAAGRGGMQPNEVDYSGYGGESWRLATLIMLILAAFFGFLSFVFELAEICLDATRTQKCLKAMSGMSLVTLVLGTLCCMIGIVTFAIETQESQNLYIMELTAFAIFQWGQSFYLGIAAVVMFIIALGIDIGGTVLVCYTAKPHRVESRHRLFYTEPVAKNQLNAETVPMIDSRGQKKHEGGQEGVSFSVEPSSVWKYPKVTWV